ncbi:MAG TPA: thiamine pyrophosphate-requiring protein [Rhizomicrobium sp.]|nr:thiamine pyrophosphate-requiring protein [Rhizomicrobium sp.]
MAKTVGDFVLERLAVWGVERVFGYPGDGINGISSALGRQDKISFIQARHEEEAAFMASGHAKLTGKVGVCLATSGPGAIHLLNGLYDAKLDRKPVVAIVGQSARMALGGHFQQEVDLLSLFKDVAGDFVQVCTMAGQARQLIDRAFRIAKSQRTVTAVIFPNDVQELKAAEPSTGHGSIHTGADFRTPLIVPNSDDLWQAAEILNKSEKVAMLVGAGAWNAPDAVIAVAERLQAGFAKALLAKAVLPDDLPFSTGQIGLLGTRASWELMRGCDTFLMIGSTFPYSEFLPKEGQAKCVQIDIDPAMLSLRYPADVALVGDAGETLRALLPLLNQKTRGTWRETIEKNVAAMWEEEGKKAHIEAQPLNPELFFWELSDRLPADAVIAADTGMSTTFFARAVKMKRGMKTVISGTLASMGPAVSYALAAKFAFPDRPAIAFVGDGAMQMLGMNGLITAAKYYRRWSDPRLIIAVLNNRDLNMVSWELRALGGSPKVTATQDLPDIDYAAQAALLGLKGLTVARPGDVARAWDEALSADRPVVIDVKADPNVIALPPHASLEQTRNLFLALARGDSDRGAILDQLIKQLAA